LFGPFEVHVNGQPLSRLRLRKSQSILALLTLRQGCEIERDWLAGLLWPASPGTQTLRNCLTDLRRALGPEAARLRSPSPRTVSLDLTGAEVDVLAFDAALARGDPGALEEAISLYRGPLLEACTEEWLFQERQVREQALLEALERLAALAEEKQDLAVAERYLRRATAVDPFRERTQRSLMELLAAGGNYAGALLIYRELRQRLHRELNAEPDPETRSLFHRLQAAAREKDAAGRSARSSGHSPAARLPAHTGNGSDPPAHLAPELFAPAAPDGTVNQRPSAQPAEAAWLHHLPLQLTSFIGRQTEMAEVRRQLAAHRLVTLTGAGGCGKTRLAIEVASALLEDYPEGVWFAALAPLANPDLVPQTVAAALGIQEQPDRPLIQTVTEALKPKHLLLVLDNCEHLIEAGAQLAETLLQGCPYLRVLATSREPLGIAGEQTYPVPSLSVPNIQAGSASDIECLLEYEAVRLFVE
jgi:DNA-binding SARP family transcriptional activator